MWCDIGFISCGQMRIYIYIELRDPKIRGLDNEDHRILGLPRTAKPTGIFCLTCERKVTDPPCFLRAFYPDSTPSPRTFRFRVEGAVNPYKHPYLHRQSR